MDSYLNKKILRQDLQDRQDYFFAEGDLFFQAFFKKAWLSILKILLILSQKAFS